MSNLKTFLKVAQKMGYPNSSPDSLVIANSIDYTLNNLLQDLIMEVGEEKTNEFVTKTFLSLGATYSPGIKIDLGDRVGDTGSYIYLIINGFDFAEGDDEYKEVWIHYTWGDSKLIGDDGGVVFSNINLFFLKNKFILGEYEQFFDDIQYECIHQIFIKTGLIIHFDSQI